MEAVTKGERLDTLQRIELAEGVSIRLRVAGLPVRAFAFAIDYLICAGILTGAIFIIGLLGMGTESEGVFGIYLLLWFLVRWFYHLPFEVGKRGATPGKRAMKIRVVRDTGTPVGVGQSVVRNLLRFVDEMPAFIATVPLVPTYLIGAVSMVCGKRFQRLGDLAAGTMVVYDDARPAPAPHPMRGWKQPPPLPSMASALPRYPLQREEHIAFAGFRERLSLWSQSRRVELANHLYPLTMKEGPEGVNEVLRIGAWIEESK